MQHPMGIDSAVTDPYILGIDPTRGSPRTRKWLPALRARSYKSCSHSRSAKPRESGQARSRLASSVYNSRTPLRSDSSAALRAPQAAATSTVGYGYVSAMKDRRQVTSSTDDVGKTASEEDEETEEETEEPLLGSPGLKRARQEVLVCHHFWHMLTKPAGVFGRSTWLIELHEALLRHHWVRAAHLLLPALGSLETWGKNALLPEIYWKAGAEVMMNHPQRSMEQFSLFANRMKSFSRDLKLKVCLEHTWNLLCQGREQEAHRELLAFTARHKDLASPSCVLLVDLIQGYCGLLHYYDWQQQKDRLSSGNDVGDTQTNSAALKEMHHSFRKSSLNFISILQKPGVWDIFTPKYVEVLHKLVPSHELMLEYSRLLHESGTDTMQERISVLMSVLDYSPWQRDVRPWQSLAELISACIKNGNEACFLEPWEVRMDWWPRFCFCEDQAKDDFHYNPLLASNKATIAKGLMGKKNKYGVRVRALKKKIPPRKKHKT
ncbi:TATA box-binding protein-associated factor RNA polymerase I subunit A isoform X2 [Petromyzon marinus]|uniref:TATA box-binding protein-associated factor RNA polymerase I subunit A isoform X2 n=1 Tax=Petromyzon marinus TaxID=7757 RepID=UPI003F6EE4FC